MNTLPFRRRAAVARALVEGNSIRDTARVTGTAKATVLRLLVDLGEFCSMYQDLVLVDLPCKRIEANEIWSFVCAKPKRATKGGQGDLWTFTAMDAESKLMVSWSVGERSPENANAILRDAASRLAERVQITTDGHRMYLSAAEAAFCWNGADYVQIVKAYGGNPDFQQEPTLKRYRPAVFKGIEKSKVTGRRDMEKVPAFHVERRNLTMHRGMRRFARLTNGFSVRAENHARAVSFYFMHYNYCRPHKALTKAAKGIKTTPAMAAGVTERVWSVEDILARMDPTRLLQSN